MEAYTLQKSSNDNLSSYKIIKFKYSNFVAEVGLEPTRDL